MIRLTISCAACLPICASWARAEGNDYRIENTGWNGLSELYNLATKRNVELLTPNALEMGQLDPDRDAIIVLFPRGSQVREPLTVSSVENFVRAGGRLAICDDFGDGEALLRHFGAERIPEPPPAPAQYGENPELPIARPWGSHPLGAGIRDVVLNHATALRSSLVPVLVASLPVALAGELGAGRFMLCSDPSIFINNMLAQPGNLVFAENLLDWLTRPRGRLYLISQEVIVRGTSSAVVGPSRSVETFLEEFNRFLHEISGRVLSPNLLRALGILFSLVPLTILLILFRPRGVAQGGGHR